MGSSDRGLRVQVHGGLGGRIDGVLALIEQASRSAPLSEVLDAMCEQLAVMGHAEVVSVYVREEEAGRSQLVLRANVGLEQQMVGRVRLELGQGITGFAAECLRPVSAEVADRDSHYQPVPELGEEHYPSFLSLPLLAGGRAIGVLNLQRSADSEFSQAEIALATALATPFGLAIERAMARNSHRPQPPDEVGRSARLAGVGLSDGTRMGIARTTRGFAGLGDPVGPGQEAPLMAIKALGAVTDQVARVLRRIEGKLGHAASVELQSLTLIPQDQRLIQLIEASCNKMGLVSGLRQVTRDYVGAPYKLLGRDEDPSMTRRAMAVEELCLWLAALACDMSIPGQGTVLVAAERLGAYAMLALLNAGAEAVVTGGAMDGDSLSVALARAGGLPLVGEVAGLFAWVREGDILLVDAGAGQLRVNPPASVVARHRHG